VTKKIKGYRTQLINLLSSFFFFFSSKKHFLFKNPPNASLSQKQTKKKEQILEALSFSVSKNLFFKKIIFL